MIGRLNQLHQIVFHCIHHILNLQSLRTISITRLWMWCSSSLSSSKTSVASLNIMLCQTGKRQVCWLGCQVSQLYFSRTEFYLLLRRDRRELKKWVKSVLNHMISLYRHRREGENDRFFFNQKRTWLLVFKTSFYCLAIPSSDKH